MSLAALARKHREKKKASQGKCFNIAMTNKGTVRRNIRKAKNCCSKIPATSNTSCECDTDTKTGCSYKGGCMTRPFVQRSYANYLRQLTTGCNKIKCNPDKSAGDNTETKKARSLKDISYNYASQCLSCKSKCSSNNSNNSNNVTLCNAFPKSNCPIDRQKCNANAIMTQLHVRTKWCATTVKDLGMRGADDRLAALKSKVLSCRNSDGSSATNPCECLSANKKCGGGGC
jgi:hypothetical protein